MKLSELNPKIESVRVLVFDCPCGGGHKLRIPIGSEKDQWEMTGKLETLTLRPSIEAGCWHGFVTNGEIVTA
jgi:hypothetical protein